MLNRKLLSIERLRRDGLIYSNQFDHKTIPPPNTLETSSEKRTKPSAIAQSTIHAEIRSPSTPPDYPAAQSPKTPQYTPQSPPAQTTHTAVAQTSSPPDSLIAPASAPPRSEERFS